MDPLASLEPLYFRTLDICWSTNSVGIRISGMSNQSRPELPGQST